MTTLRLISQIMWIPALIVASVVLSSCTSTDPVGGSQFADELALEDLEASSASTEADELDLELDSDETDSEVAVEDGNLPQDLASEELNDMDGGSDLDFEEELDVASDAQESAMPQIAAPTEPSVVPPVELPGEPPVEPSVVESQVAVGETETDFDPTPETQSDTRVTDIRYVSQKNGGTVVVETSSPASYHTREVTSQNQVVMEIANALLPEKLKRPYVTKDFRQNISSINAYQDRGSSTVRVVVQFRAPPKFQVQQNGRALNLTAGTSRQSNDEFADEFTEVAGAPAASASFNSGNESDDEDSYAPSGEQTSSAQDPRILPSSASDPAAFDNIKFYGRPISIEVRDTPVREVINLIAEQSGANIVLGGEVDGNISLKLRQIPWDQALLIVMKTRNLGYVRQGSILRIAPYEALQRETDSARRVVEAQKAAEPLRVKVIPVGYAKVDAMEKQISAFLTKERGHVVADVRTNSLVVTDTTEVLERISNLVRALDTPPLQVLIEGKVVEAREVFNRAFGLNWSASGQDVELGNGIGLRQNITISPGSQSARGTGASIGMRIGTLDIFGDLNANLRLFEKEDLIKIVSSPRVVVLNNEQASILQGMNIPVKTTTQGPAGSTESVEFQPIEMRLEVTPQVTSESDIILQLDIKREFATNRVENQPPDINTREAKTKVLVRNGHTAVVGGVYQSDMAEVESGVPWLRRIPVLGWLFKHREVNNEKSELLVFLTPRILNAEAAQKENSL